MSVYINPYSSSRRWLRGNLHAHTCCGRFMDISESGPMFASLGYDFLAITDHNKAPDEEQWRIWQEQANLILIPGEENGGTDHILEIGVHEMTPTTNGLYADRAQALRDGGGFIAGCHPQEYADGSEKIHAGAESLHAVELFNGLREARGRDESANIALWDDVLTTGKQIWGIATDDFHCAYVTPGHGWVCVQVSEDIQTVPWQMIVEQLKAGAFFSSTYPNFTELTLDNGTLRVSADGIVRRLRVIGPEAKTLYEVNEHTLEWQTEPDLTYFRVEAECGIKRAWSQPFFPA